MEYVERLLKNQTFVDTIAEIERLEESRLFCKHDLNHLLDVARIAYIMNLELELGLDKEMIYLGALLHDIGRGKEYAEGIKHDIAGVALAEEILDEIQCPKKYRDEVLEIVADHRNAPNMEDAINRENLFWFADKRARNCYACKVSDACNWAQEKRTKTIDW